MTGCIFTGGLGPPRQACAPYLEKADLTVAADSGLLLARSFGIRPDYIVGDMDSLPEPSILDEYDCASVLRYPRDKDDTDTELGLRLAREKGADELILIGGGGGRMEHFLAVYSLFHRENPPSAWLTDSDEILLIASRHTLCGFVGEEFSLFPLGAGPVRMRSRGLKWPLDRLEWKVGDIGIHNVLADNYGEIEVMSGALLLMRPWGNRNGI